MTAEKLIAIFKMLAWGGHPRAFRTVAQDAGATVAEVHEVIALIKRVPCFHFELTKTGRVKNLEIVAQAKGFYGQAYMLDGDDIFFKDGTLVARFGNNDADKVMPFSKQLAGEADVDGFPFIPLSRRIEAITPYLLTKMQANPG